MDHATVQPTIKISLAEIRSKLNKAARIAKTAEACAEAGSISEGVSMDIEQPVYEAGRRQDAASRSIGCLTNNVGFRSLIFAHPHRGAVSVAAHDAVVDA
jgi:hypothetical protein